MSELDTALDALGPTRDLAGEPAVAGDGHLVVVAGALDVFFVALDADGQPQRPALVATLQRGDVLRANWTRDAALGLPDGRVVLRSVGPATVAEPAAPTPLDGALSAAARRGDELARAFAHDHDWGDDGSADLAERARLDEALASASERDLLRVFEFARLSHAPEGATPLVAALLAAGCDIAPDRLMGVTTAHPGQQTVEELAARLRVPIRAVVLEPGWWADVSGPLIARHGGDPVTLLPRGRRYVLRRPGHDDRPVDAALAASIDPAAYLVYPRLPAGPATTRDVLALALHGSRAMIAWLAAMTVAVAALGAFLPYATSQVVGEIVPAGENAALRAILAALAAFTLALLVAGIIQALAVLAISSRGSTALTAAVWDRLLHVSPSFFHHRSSGTLSQQVTAIDQMRSLVGSSLVVALAGCGLGVSAVALLIAYAPAVAVGAVGTTAVVLALAARLIVGQERAQERVISQRNRLNGLLLGLFSGVAKLRVAGAERRAHALWQQGYALQQEAQREATVQVVRLTVLQGLVPGLMVLAAVVAAGVSATATLVTFTASLAAAGQLGGATVSLLAVAGTYVQLRPLYRSARPILQATAEVRAGAALPSSATGDLRLEDVTFGYTDGAPTVEHVSFVAPAGSFVAIVGPSGAGKTTLVRLILGFETPWSGAVLLDDKPLDSYDLEAVRRRMGTVIQGAQITAGTVLTNIVGTLPLGVQAAWRAAELAGIAEDIRRMPMQMSTRVPDGGIGFSGGQLQRLLLARALVREPKLLLLDEATSALDNETQRQVMANLGAAGVTRIVVAHRLSTVRDADRIVVVNRGRVVEAGPFDELMTSGGLFAQLAGRQLL